MQKAEDSLLEIKLVMRLDGASYITALYSPGIPPGAVPTMIRGALAVACQRIPDSVERFDCTEIAPPRSETN